ncbi:MAG: DNA-directed RNA polymerase subunit omega [bacterium]
MDQKLMLIDKLEGLTRNRYEAVLVASKRARQINAERLAKLEMMIEDADITIDYRKVTTIALEELVVGKVRVVKK